jgi:hypothetical protein
MPNIPQCTWRGEASLETLCSGKAQGKYHNTHPPRVGCLLCGLWAFGVFRRVEEELLQARTCMLWLRMRLGASTVVGLWPGATTVFGLWLSRKRRP